MLLSNKNVRQGDCRFIAGMATGRNDLSARCSLFRAKLIEEFRLSDNVAYNTRDAPVLSSSEITNDPDLFKQTLRDTPTQLIKFKIFKRSSQQYKGISDRRMTRIKNMNTIPVGVWASWFTNSPHSAQASDYLDVWSFLQHHGSTGQS